MKDFFSDMLKKNLSFDFHKFFYAVTEVKEFMKIKQILEIIEYYMLMLPWFLTHKTIRYLQRRKNCLQLNLKKKNHAKTKI